MAFNVKVIEDSISIAGKRLTTLQLCYPRFIHAEARTHRVINNSGEEYEIVHKADISFMSDKSLSRNASSSRAIPVKKMIEQVRNDPAMPIHWGKNQPGMQALEELHEPVYLQKALMPLDGFAYGHSEDWKDTDIELTGVMPDDAWGIAAERACQIAEAFMEAGYHKQVVNRILEPFQWMHVIVTATEWDNFFDLRDHEDAEPNIRFLAEMMRQAMADSAPRLITQPSFTVRGPFSAEWWHLPYVSSEERYAFQNQPKTLVKLSAARCARVSYLNHDGTKPDLDKDLELYDRLVGGKPMHASPIEHQAFPAPTGEIRSGNFIGFIQYRKLVEANQY